MKWISELLRRRWVRMGLALGAAAILGAALVVTIYLTIFDLQWFAFLGGVLFAALLAMASQVSRSEWRVARRTRQLERMREQLERAREQLAQEAGRSRSAAEAMRIVDVRMRLLSDALPSLILFVDRDERVRYHNAAVEARTGLAADKITGYLLREIVGTAVYLNVVPHIAGALSGQTVDYEITWETTSRGGPPYYARHIPYFAEDPQPRGFYLLLSRKDGVAAATAPAPAARAAEPAPDAEDDTLVADGAETLYVRSMTEELMGGDDPRIKLARALRENQFLLFAQKILPLKSGAPDPLCYEILLRLQEEEDHLLPPGGFIPVAEHYGMMEDLDRWVARTVISWSAGKQSADPAWRVPLFCVNLSEAAIRSVEFASFVYAELQRSTFPRGSLCFEISEQDVINHHADVERLIADLKPAGCRFTIDAFGSVKVSFSYLKGLKIDFIKIDGSVTQNIVRDPSELAKVRAINTVCQKIGVKSIAEFVETSEMLEKLREAGVDYVQGFGIARPGPISELG